MNRAPSFAADVMLGKLARWLRLMGFDTFYSNTAGDDELADLCHRENRLLLSRDTPLCRRLGDRAYFVTEIDVSRQLREVVAAFGLDRFDLPPRCNLCNGTLIPEDKRTLAGQVPPYVYRTQEEFFRCTGCRRIYWPGTHLPKIRKRVAALRGLSRETQLSPNNTLDT